MGNNPVRYTDPSGHKECEEIDEYGNCINNNGLTFEDLLPKHPSSVDNGAFPIDPFENAQKQVQYCVQNPFNPVCTTPMIHFPPQLCPTMTVFDIKHIDWADVVINLVGAAGDVGLLSTLFGDPVGPEFWLLTEGVELIGIAKDTYGKDYAALTGDGLAIAVDVIAEQKNAQGLIPGIGIFFNVANIFSAVEEGYIDVGNCDSPWILR